MKGIKIIGKKMILYEDVLNIVVRVRQKRCTTDKGLTHTRTYLVVKAEEWSDNFDGLSHRNVASIPCS